MWLYFSSFILVQRIEKLLFIKRFINIVLLLLLNKDEISLNHKWIKLEIFNRSGLPCHLPDEIFKVCGTFLLFIEIFSLFLR